MATCDVCNASTSWEQGTAYSPEEFRKLADKGFEPEESTIQMMTVFGVSRKEAIDQWKFGLVASSTTGWLLCPRCASRAGRYLPKPAGTGPGTMKMTEPVTPQMLFPTVRPPSAPTAQAAAEPPASPFPTTPLMSSTLGKREGNPYAGAWFCSVLSLLIFLMAIALAGYSLVWPLLGW